LQLNVAVKGILAQQLSQDNLKYFRTLIKGMCSGKLNHFHPEQYIDAVVAAGSCRWGYGSVKMTLLNVLLYRDGVKNKLILFAIPENSAVSDG